jgi:hypothetical protein
VLPPLRNYTGTNDSSIVKIGVSLLVVPARASETAILLVPSLILPGTEKQEHQCEHKHDGHRELGRLRIPAHPPLLPQAQGRMWHLAISETSRMCEGT